jgi:hypothetical protein
MIALPAIAYADSTGAEGTIESLTVYSSASSSYSQKRGQVKLRENGGTLRTYVFGGSKCQYKNLSMSQINLLAGAVNSGTQHFVPLYVSGLSNSRCLVGVRLRKPTGGGPA